MGWIRTLSILGASGIAAAGAGLGALSMAISDKTPPVVIRNPEQSIKLPSRADHLKRLRSTESFDILVIGGGATGCGVALDATTRNLNTLLLERDDFASATSCRSTKLVHGGVRYLEKAVQELDWEQLRLVDEALTERGVLLRTAPHLVHPIPLIVPLDRWWKIPRMWIGCKLYDFISGKAVVGESYYLNKAETIQRFPTLAPEHVAGAMVMYEGQMNDSRLCATVAVTAASKGATMLNHTEVVSLEKEDGRIVGAVAKDKLTGEEFRIRAKVVVNATGPFADSILKMDNPHGAEAIKPSLGSHLILPARFASPDMGMLIPETDDKRILFFLPWQGRVIAGTTDRPAHGVCQNPMPSNSDVSWILKTVNKYLSVPITEDEVLSVWTGIRPLAVAPHQTPKRTTAQISRDHVVYVSDSGLVSINGGKWTTFRLMAEDTLDRAVTMAKLNPGPCVTRQMMLLGGDGYTESLHTELEMKYGLKPSVANHLANSYGDRAPVVAAIAQKEQLGRLLSTKFDYIEAEVLHAVRSEYACTVTDVLARRMRLAFLDRREAANAIPRVVALMSKELGWNKQRQQEEELAARRFMKSFEPIDGEACGFQG